MYNTLYENDELVFDYIPIGNFQGIMADLGTDVSIQGESVQKKSLKEGVFELLHQRIVAGKYSPGEWLRQEDIALQLGVSQTPVREALDLMVSVGLAERAPYRGVRVPHWTHEEIVDSYIIRLILENAAARLAARNITPEHMRFLTEIISRTKGLITLEDMSTQRQLNKKFHLAIAEASGNFLLSKLYEMASNMFPDWRLYEYMFRHPEILDISLAREYKEHCSLLDAIASHAPEQAACQAITHIRNLKMELNEFLGIPLELIQEKEEQIEPLLSCQ